jgi:Glycosyl-transferase family 4
VRTEDYDVIVVNTIVMWDWIKSQVEVNGLDFYQKVLFWVHELPVGSLRALYFGGGTTERRIIAQSAAVIVCTRYVQDLLLLGCPL